jgi:uncharacterized membrane protein YidH (DUF202 family)
MIRTYLANTRSMLAYTRTCLPFLALALKDMDTQASAAAPQWSAAIIYSVVFALFVFVGVCDWFREKPHIAKHFDDSDQLALIRSRLANRNTLLAFVRTIIVFALLAVVAATEPPGPDATVFILAALSWTFGTSAVLLSFVGVHYYCFLNRFNHPDKVHSSALHHTTNDITTTALPSSLPSPSPPLPLAPLTPPS